MRRNLEFFWQLLFAVLMTVIGVGTVAAVSLPYWLAIRAALLFSGFFVGGSFVLLCISLLWCGMALQRRDDDARIMGLLKKAGL